MGTPHAPATASLHMGGNASKSSTAGSAATATGSHPAMRTLGDPISVVYVAV